MANFRILFFLLSSSTIFVCHRSASAFLPTTIESATTKSQFKPRTLPHYPDTSFLALHAGFEQLPGESSTEFIKRITNQSDELFNEKKDNQTADESSSSEKNNDNDNASKPVGKYQRIEEWDAERTAKGELSWEEKVQFDGQRHGNQFKQDSILRRFL